MRTIGILIVALILLPSSSLREMRENKSVPSPDSKKQTVFKSHLLTDPCSALLKPPKKKTDIDTKTLKQSDWYANVIKNIQDEEYEIKRSENKNFTAPNLQQNLRTTYTADQFILEPGEKDDWKLQLTLKGVYSGKEKIYSPQQNAIAVTDKNKIQFSHNNEFNVEYINSKEGVRQNFIIEHEPVSKPQTLNLKLQTNKGWFVNKVHDREIHFAKRNGEEFENKITYNDLKVWDANKKELEASFSVSKNEFLINVNTANAVYPITIDPLSTTPSTTLTGGAGAASGDYFANNVASAGDVNGDGYSDVIVGAPGVSSNRGKIYLFLGNPSGLSTSPITTLNGISGGDYFGCSVASAGDVNADGYSDIIVGAYGVSSSKGAAYLFLGNSSGIPTSSTVLNGSTNGDMFGRSVALAGDVNSDGFSDVMVGANGVSSNMGHCCTTTFSKILICSFSLQVF